jgi:hypothetical protein
MAMILRQSKEMCLSLKYQRYNSSLVLLSSQSSFLIISGMGGRLSKSTIWAPPGVQSLVLLSVSVVSVVGGGVVKAVFGVTGKPLSLGGMTCVP